MHNDYYALSEALRNNGVEIKLIEPDGKMYDVQTVSYEVLPEFIYEPGYRVTGNIAFYNSDGNVSDQEGCRIVIREATDDGKLAEIQILDVLIEDRRRKSTGYADVIRSTFKARKLIPWKYV